MSKAVSARADEATTMVATSQASFNVPCLKGGGGVTDFKKKSEKAVTLLMSTS